MERCSLLCWVCSEFHSSTCSYHKIVVPDGVRERRSLHVTRDWFLVVSSRHCCLELRFGCMDLQDLSTFVEVPSMLTGLFGNRSARFGTLLRLSFLGTVLAVALSSRSSRFSLCCSCSMIYNDGTFRPLTLWWHVPVLDRTHFGS